MPTKISHPSCCEFACGRIIRWGKKPWADTNIKVLLVISRYKASQDSVIVSGLLTEKSELLLCFNYAASQRSVWGLLWNSELTLNQPEDPVEDVLLVFFFQCLDPNDLTGDGLIRSLPRSFELVPVSRRSIRETEYDTLRLTGFYHQWNWRRIRL